MLQIAFISCNMHTYAIQITHKYFTLFCIHPTHKTNKKATNWWPFCYDHITIFSLLTYRDRNGLFTCIVNLFGFSTHNLYCYVKRFIEISITFTLRYRKSLLLVVPLQVEG